MLTVSLVICVAVLIPEITEFFTTRSHLHFEPKFTSRGLKKFKKLPPVGIELTTPSLDLRLNAYPNRPQRPVLLGRPLIEVCFMHRFTFEISLKHV